ncbi:MAG: ATPase AAA [Candidatus Tectimicrobiota bacterium]|nr:MAG: ATPase AAA [Candidatus Tectomicrobia bacterium]
MTEPLADQVLQKLGEARALYYRLLLVVALAGSGKTSALQAVSALTSAPLLNVNLELSRRMLDLPERRRALQLPRLLQDPLRLLQKISRYKTIVAAWPGEVVDPDVACGREDTRRTTPDAGRYLTYAAADHPEDRRYPIRDVLVVSPGGLSGRQG